METTHETAAGPAAGMPLAPSSGYRNYWYPMIESDRVTRKPIHLRIVGEDLVLFRTDQGVSALVDRCPHRGAMLSMGRSLFPNTISCAYHGWTYDGRGECLAAIVEGPDSQIPGRVRVKSFPTAERWGVVWGYIGEGTPPSLLEDIPPQLEEENVLRQFMFEDWSCNWRNITENYPDMLHAIFVHRTSPESVFQKLPAWGSMIVEKLPDDKGIYVRGGGGGLQADYPGLGRFPEKAWFRRFSRRDTRGVGAQVRMPGYIVLPERRDHLFGHPVVSIQWPVPIDDDHTRIFECTVTRPKNVKENLALRLWWNAYYKHVHMLFFVHQDKRIIEGQTYRAAEHLSVSDAGLLQWRAFAARASRERDAAVAAPGASAVTADEIVEQLAGAIGAW